MWQILQQAQDKALAEQENIQKAKDNALAALKEMTSS